MKDYQKMHETHRVLKELGYSDERVNLSDTV